MTTQMLIAVALFSLSLLYITSCAHGASFRSPIRREQRAMEVEIERVPEMAEVDEGSGQWVPILVERRHREPLRFGKRFGLWRKYGPLPVLKTKT